MNKSYSKIRHIQESNLKLEKRLLSEQVKATLTPSNQPSNLQATTNVQSRTINPTKGSQPADHDLNQIFAFGALFIPVVGPFISIGIGLSDALAYANEGKDGEAGVSAFFALLPGIGSVVGKIPGIKQLGQKGMQALVTKLASKVPLNAVEQGVVTGINLNKELIKRETNNVVKNIASKAVGKMTSKASKEAMIDIAKEGLEMKAEDIAMSMVAAKPVQGAIKAGTTGKGAYNPIAVVGNYKPGGTTQRT